MRWQVLQRERESRANEKEGSFPSCKVPSIIFSPFVLLQLITLYHAFPEDPQEWIWGWGVKRAVANMWVVKHYVNNYGSKPYKQLSWKETMKHWDYLLLKNMCQPYPFLIVFSSNTLKERLYSTFLSFCPWLKWFFTRMENAESTVLRLEQRNGKFSAQYKGQKKNKDTHFALLIILYVYTTSNLSRQFHFTEIFSQRVTHH